MNETEIELKSEETEQGEQDLPSMELIYAEVKDRLDVQLRQVDSMDSKSGTLLFIASVVIGMGAAAQAALIGTVKESLPLVLFSIPILFYVVCVLLTIRSWVRRPYFRDPEPRPLRDYYLAESYQFTKRRIMSHFISSYEWNAAVIKKKVNELRYAVWFFLAEVVSLTVVLATRPWLTQIFGG